MADTSIDIDNVGSSKDTNNGVPDTKPITTTPPNNTVITIPTLVDTDNGVNVDNNTDKPTVPSTLPKESNSPKTFAEACAYCKTKMILALAHDAAFILVLLALAIYLLKRKNNG